MYLTLRVEHSFLQQLGVGFCGTAQCNAALVLGRVEHAPVTITAEQCDANEVKEELHVCRPEIEKEYFMIIPKLPQYCEAAYLFAIRHLVAWVNPAISQTMKGVLTRSILA
jgi:hypothetical protein